MDQLASMYPSSFEIAPFVGPCFVIVWFSFILYGLFLAQIYIYFTTYQDHIAVKLAVVLLGVLETLQVASCIHILYTDLIVDFAMPIMLLDLIWSDSLVVSLEIIINGIVQSYYVYRIWRLSRNVPIVVVLCIELGARIAIAFRTNAFSYMHNNWLELESLKEYKAFVVATLSLSVLLDASITFILLFYLSRAHSLALKRSTRSTLHKLIYYALSTGGLTTLTTIVTLIVFKTSTSPILYGGLIVIMAKVYANSMLAMLNIRQGLRMGAISNDASCVHLSEISSRIEPAHAMERVHVLQKKTVQTDDFSAMTKIASERWIES